MKHAYLIIAHHEFEILSRLVNALDDGRNDIYIHFDKKVTSIPVLTADRARLHILSNRIDVRWGDVSQIESELVLFQEALGNGPYAYYHMLSGVDLPLKSQDFIHRFFEVHRGKEFIDFNANDNRQEISRKVQRRHLYPRHFRSVHGAPNTWRRLLRSVFLRIQYLFFISRHRKVQFKKGLNWVSVSQQFVRYLLEKKHQLLKDYRYTFCADEIFLQTVCWNSPFRDRVFEADQGGSASMRITSWRGNQLADWEERDFDTLKSSDALFARKFSARNIEIVNKVLEKISCHV